MPRYMSCIMVVCLLACAWVASGQEELPQILSLQDAMRLALERNRSLSAAEEELDSREAALEGQKGRWLPQLTADWSWRLQQSLPRQVNIGGGTIETQAQRSTTRDLALNLTQTFYQSGLSESIDAARQQVRITELGLDNTRRQLLMQVTSTWHTILADREMAQVAEQAVEASEMHLALVEAQIEAGAAAPTDRLPVEAELADARYESVRTVNAVWQSIADLQALLALPPQSLPRLDEAPELDYARGELESWIEEALAHRPDLRAQEHQVRASELSLEQAKTDAGVSLNVAGQADYGRHTGTSGESWSVGASASFPLHDGQAQAGVDQARANLRAARERLAERQIQVTQEVSQAWYALGDASERVAAAEASVAAAEANLEVARARYVEDVADIVEVTDAELSWRRAMGQLVQSRYDRNVAYYQLLSAAGRLLIEPEAQGPAESDTVVEQ